jgi:hypothetical protein
VPEGSEPLEGDCRPEAEDGRAAGLSRSLSIVWQIAILNPHPERL